MQREATLEIFTIGNASRGLSTDCDPVMNFLTLPEESAS